MQPKSFQNGAPSARAKCVFPDDASRDSKREKPKTIQQFVQRYPHVLTKIKEAGGLATAEQAAVILRDAVERRKNYSDWVLSKYQGDAMRAVGSALRVIR